MGNRRVTGLILDREQLCGALGVSDSAITAWEKKGLPTVRRGRGRGMRSLYDLDVVRAWCAKTGYGHSTQALLARFSRSEPPPAPSPAPAPAPVQTPGRAAEEQEDYWFGFAVELALLNVPAIAARAGMTELQIDALAVGILEAFGAELARLPVVPAELRKEMIERLRDMLDEERAAPGSWTT